MRGPVSAFMEEIMTQFLPTTRSLHFAEVQIEYRRYQPVVLLEHDNISYPLPSTWSDTVHVFEHRRRLYVLIVNKKLATVRLDIYAGKEQAAMGSVILVEQEEIEQILGASWQNLSPKTLAVLLASQLLRKGGVA
jgi:hypothetical protein